jgi:hypothetical protein
MKFLACDMCQVLIPLAHKAIKCKCGAIEGVYLPDDNSIIVSLKDYFFLDESRLIAISNHFFFGESDEHGCWVIPWDHEKVWYYIQETEKLYHNGEELDEERAKLLPESEAYLSKIFLEGLQAVPDEIQE